MDLQLFKVMLQFEKVIEIAKLVHMIPVSIGFIDANICQW